MKPNQKNVTTSFCPYCLYEVDSATCIDGSDAQPSIGDYSICINCKRPLRFGYDFQLRRLTPKERVEFMELMAELKSKCPK